MPVCMSKGWMQPFSDDSGPNDAGLCGGDSDGDVQETFTPTDWLAVAASHHKVIQPWTSGQYASLAGSPWRQEKAVSCNFNGDTWGLIMENLL